MLKKIIKQFVYFFGIGVIGTLFDYIIYSLLVLFGQYYLSATIIGNIIGSLINYLLNKKFTFKNKTEKIFKQIIKYILSVLLYMIGTFCSMMVMVEVFNIDKYLSRFIVLGIMTMINFSVNKYFVFKQ